MHHSQETTKETLEALKELNVDIQNPFKVLAVLENHFPKLLESHYARIRKDMQKKRSYLVTLFNE